MILLAAACADQSPTNLERRFHVTAPGTYSFRVLGATFGPKKQEMQPYEDCNPGAELSMTQQQWTLSGGLPKTLTTFKNETARPSSLSRPFCELGPPYDSAGGPYIGGEIGAWATIADTTKGLFNLLADLTEQAETVDVPADAVIRLEAQRFSGYWFMGWRIRRSDGTDYIDPQLVIYRTAGATTDYQFVAEFAAGSGPGSPPPDDPPDTCDDPSVPGCDPEQPSW